MERRHYCLRPKPRKRLPQSTHGKPAKQGRATAPPPKQTGTQKRQLFGLPFSLSRIRSASLPACAKYTRRYIFTSAPLPVHNGTAFRNGIAIPFVRQKARDVVPKRLPQRVYAVQIHHRVAYRLLRIAAAQKGGTVLCQAATGFERLRRGFVAIKDKRVKVLRNSELYSNTEEWPTSESIDYKPFKKKGRY